LDVTAASIAGGGHRPALDATGGAAAASYRSAAIRRVSFKPHYPVGGPSALIWNRALARADEGKRGSRPDPRETGSRHRMHDDIVDCSASRRPDVVAANDAAKRRGIVAGLSIAAALALDPEIAIHLRDERAEAAALKSIALWAGQWTSTISIEPPAIVLLEISACLNYFEGLPKLLARI